MTGKQDTDWQLYWDNGNPAQSTALVAHDGSSTFTFSVGRAFWLIRKGAWTVNRTDSSAQLDTSGSVLIPLHTGWNQITNPFSNSIYWATVQNANGSLDPIFGYYGTFAQSTTMDPYVGYCLFNRDNRPSIKIPFLTGGAPKKIRAALDEGSWRVDIALNAGGMSERCATIGVSPSAEEGIDGLDYRKPRAPGSIPQIVFLRPEWDSNYPVFGTDIRRQIGAASIWTMEVTGAGGKESRLSFEGLAGVPSDMAVYLIDVERATSHDLRKDAEYTVVPRTARAPFRIVVGTRDAVEKELDAMLPREFALENNFPNPFNPATTIPVAVPRASQVSLIVFNLLGEEVRSLHSGPLPAGRHWFTWDGRNDAGRAVASGVYLCRLTVETGQAFARKMILMK
jgi:hypothetical protein